VTTQDVYELLEKRLGRRHARLRFGVENEHEAQVFDEGIDYFHIGNLRLSPLMIRTCLKLTGLYGRGCRNAAQIEVRHNHIRLPKIPKAFDGFVILHLSDLHVDMNQGAMEHLRSILQEIKYDLCVFTGDYRGKSFGPYEEALLGMARVCAELRKPQYGVLGDHDTIRMTPGLEEIGIRMLLNESITIERDNQHIHLAGIDDAHFYGADNIEKAASEIPRDEFSILLSHTPEIYRWCAPRLTGQVAGCAKH
jgi:predicted MPP superfamily phosphohydrolase